MEKINEKAKVYKQHFDRPPASTFSYLTVDFQLTGFWGGRLDDANNVYTFGPKEKTSK